VAQAVAAAAPFLRYVGAMACGMHTAETLGARGALLEQYTSLLLQAMPAMLQGAPAGTTPVGCAARNAAQTADHIAGSTDLCTTWPSLSSPPPH
jgi:hypothetical protein